MDGARSLLVLVLALASCSQLMPRPSRSLAAIVSPTTLLDEMITGSARLEGERSLAISSEVGSFRFDCYSETPACGYGYAVSIPLVPDQTNHLTCDVEGVCGAASASPTPTPTPGSACLGDCNGDGVVTVDDIITGVGIALGTVPFDKCPAFDCTSECGPGPVLVTPSILRITVDCLIQGANHALKGCPPVPCRSDDECGDGNGCTFDRCTPDGCVHECVCV